MCVCDGHIEECFFCYIDDMYKIIFALLYLEEQKYFLLYMLLLFFIRVVYIILRMEYLFYKI